MRLQPTCVRYHQRRPALPRDAALRSASLPPRPIPLTMQCVASFSSCNRGLVEILIKSNSFLTSQCHICFCFLCQCAFFTRICRLNQESMLMGKEEIKLTKRRSHVCSQEPSRMLKDGASVPCRRSPAGLNSENLDRFPSKRGVPKAEGETARVS